MRELFGDWKSPKPFARVPSAYQDVRAAESTLIQTPDKTNAFFLAGLNLQLRDDDPDYPALVLGNYMLGGGFLNSRLATADPPEGRSELRRQPQLQVSSLDKSGTSRRRHLRARRTPRSWRPPSRKRWRGC